MVWSQVYDPLNNPWLSTSIAALPVIVLLGALGVFRVQAHIAALLGLAVALASAIFIFGMPAPMKAFAPSSEVHSKNDPCAEGKIMLR